MNDSINNNILHVPIDKSNNFSWLILTLMIFFISLFYNRELSIIIQDKKVCRLIYLRTVKIKYTLKLRVPLINKIITNIQSRQIILLWQWITQCKEWIEYNWFLMDRFIAEYISLRSVMVCKLMLVHLIPQNIYEKVRSLKYFN